MPSENGSKLSNLSGVNNREMTVLNQEDANLLHISLGSSKRAGGIIGNQDDKRQVHRTSNHGYIHGPL